MHNGGHLTLAPLMVEALREPGLDTPVVIGGIVPDDDLPPLEDAGSARCSAPGLSAEAVETVRRAARG